jgi:hypothetical protein
MANSKLLEIKPGSGLVDGIYPSAENTVGAIWKSGKNVWFRTLDVRSSVGKEAIIGGLTRASKEMAQASEQDFRALYYESNGLIYKSDDFVTSSLIHTVNSDGIIDLEPWGRWVLITDNTNQPVLYKRDEPNAPVPIGGANFSTVKIFKKLAARALAFCTDVYPAGFHWCNPKNVEDWTPSVAGGAGYLPLRSFDSEIMAVAELSGALAVYSKSRMVVVQYLGPPYYFGTPNQALTGIGAAGKECVISKGSRNIGLSFSGMFMTDGTGVERLGNPAIDEFIQEQVDFDKGEQITGFDDVRSELVTWMVPLLSGEIVGITMDSKGKFSIIELRGNAALTKDVYRTALVAEGDKIYAYGVTGTVLGEFQLQSHLLDAGIKERYKVWEYAMFEGTVSGEVRFGFTDQDNFDAIEWNPWEPLKYKVPFTPRESVYIAMEFRGDQNIKLSGITLYGGQGGLVL